MAKEYSKTTGCKDANEILKKWLERRKKGMQAEEKILSALIADESTASCIPIVAKQLKQIFDKDIDNVIKEAIELQIEREKPHELITPEPPAGEMRGWKKVIEGATSIDELNAKLKEATDKMDEVYADRTDMKILWTKRLNTARDEVLKKIERMQSNGRRNNH